MNVISSTKRCRLELATAAFCGCGKCGGGHLTVSGLLLFSFNDAGAAQAPCPHCARHPSLNICYLCGKIKMMLSKREVNSNRYTTPAVSPQGMGKNRNVTQVTNATPNNQKSENTERRYTYGMGTPSLGRCPVAPYVTVK